MGCISKGSFWTRGRQFFILDGIRKRVFLFQHGIRKRFATKKEDFTVLSPLGKGRRNTIPLFGKAQ